MRECGGSRKSPGLPKEWRRPARQEFHSAVSSVSMVTIQCLPRLGRWLASHWAHQSAIQELLVLCLCPECGAVLSFQWNSYLSGLMSCRYTCWAGHSPPHHSVGAAWSERSQALRAIVGQPSFKDLLGLALSPGVQHTDLVCRLWVHILIS